MSLRPSAETTCGYVSLIPLPEVIFWLLYDVDQVGALNVHTGPSLAFQDTLCVPDA